MSEESNEYTVHTIEGTRGWEVQILDPQGAVAWTRPCATQSEARTFASTVRQHVYWLSPQKFREYYKLAEPA
jgi:hypothetical protein